ncbi:hypothetical protein J2S30_003315 [Herbaspirillum rubrisubalbicans]|uniref:hypothetical protein n=1 Tax=Herbaspirillum rubrisubalbicans TaxID=80842 RepID=UPI0020A14C99|nr:hypothetical protein [Herbaspirillum rubrisubalbicans]MCP1574936.1 hypothetical protein [Herbaspirillum rubrisubalbicans]
MYRHSFLLGLALLAAGSSQAQSNAPATTQYNPPATASAFDKETRLLSLPAAISLAFDQNKTLAAARKEIEAVEATILQGRRQTQSRVLGAARGFPQVQPDHHLPDHAAHRARWQAQRAY